MPEKKPQIALEALRRLRAEFLSLEEAASILGLSDQTLRRWAKEGAEAGQLLPIEKFGGTVRIHRTAFVWFLNTLGNTYTYIDPGYEPPPIEDYDEQQF